MGIRGLPLEHEADDIVVTSFIKYNLHASIHLSVYCLPHYFWDLVLLTAISLDSGTEPVK